MSTSQDTQPTLAGWGTDSPTLDVTDTAKIPFQRLVRVELRKMMDTRAGMWLIISMAVVTALVMVIQLIVVLTQDLSVNYGDFIAGTTYSIGILLPILGILSLTSEWGQRTAMVSFTLEPRRAHVIAAKLACVVILAVASVLLALVFGAVANVLFGAFGGTVAWGFGINQFLGFLALQILGVLTGFALAALFLNSPAAIVGFFVYTWILPPLLGIGAALIDWFAKVQPWIDFSAAQLPLTDASMGGQEWAHLVVSGGIWLVLPLVLGLMRVLRAEVK